MNDYLKNMAQQSQFNDPGGNTRDQQRLRLRCVELAVEACRSMAVKTSFMMDLAAEMVEFVEGKETIEPLE